MPGDFAVRGGIIDVYLPGEHEESADQVGLTARIDFFGDQIESIKQFDLDSLGSRQAAAVAAPDRPQGQAPRHRRVGQPVQLPAGGDGRRPLGAAGNRRAGQELPRPAAGGEGHLPAAGGPAERRAVHPAGAEPVRPGRDGDAEPRRRQGGAARPAADPVAAAVRDRGEEGDRRAGGAGRDARRHGLLRERRRGQAVLRAGRAGAAGAVQEAASAGRVSAPRVRVGRVATTASPGRRESGSEGGENRGRRRRSALTLASPATGYAASPQRP